MKKSDIYEISIKILGLYLVVILIEQLRNVLSAIPIIFQSEASSDYFNQTTYFWMMVVGLVILTLFTWLLIFRSKNIMRFITNPRDREEKVSLFATKENIFEVSLVLLGLILFVWVLPDFLLQLKRYIQQVQSDIPIKNYDKTFIISAGIKIVLAIIAIAYSGSIARLLTRVK